MHLNCKIYYLYTFKKFYAQYKNLYFYIFYNIIYKTQHDVGNNKNNILMRCYVLLEKYGNLNCFFFIS